MARSELRGERGNISAGDGQFRPRAKSGLGTEKSVPDLEISHCCLLIGESLHRGDAGGPMSGQQTSSERRHGDGDGGAREYHPVESGHLEEDRLHGSSCQPCTHHAEYHAASEQS